MIRKESFGGINFVPCNFISGWRQPGLKLLEWPVGILLQCAGRFKIRHGCGWSRRSWEKHPRLASREIAICPQIMLADRRSLRSVKPRGWSVTPLDAATQVAQVFSRCYACCCYVISLRCLRPYLKLLRNYVINIKLFIFIYILYN